MTVSSPDLSASLATHRPAILRYIRGIVLNDAEAEDLTCAADRVELAAFLAEHPDRGMPFGLPEVSQDEFETIASWLAQGGVGPSPEQQAELTAPSRVAAAEIGIQLHGLVRRGGRLGLRRSSVHRP